MSDPKSSGPSFWGVGARWLMVAGVALVLAAVSSAVGLRLLSSAPTVPSTTISPSPVPSGPTFVDPITIVVTDIVVPTEAVEINTDDVIVLPTEDWVVLPTGVELPTLIGPFFPDPGLTSRTEEP